MAPSRACVPSSALLRALNRPHLHTCPISRRLPAQGFRSLRTRTAPPNVDSPKSIPQRPNLAHLDLAKLELPTEHDLGGVNKTRIESIEWYEADMDGKNERLVDIVAKLPMFERTRVLFDLGQFNMEYAQSIDRAISEVCPQ